MTTDWQIPRNCLAWLLSAQLLLIAPHSFRLPLWVLLAFAAAALWRIMIYQGRWSLPPFVAKLAMTLGSFAGIYFSYGTFLGLEPTVALLVTGFSLKLIEMSSRRDVYVVIFLGFFVALTQFLFNQDFFPVLYVFLSLLVLIAALVGLHQHQYQQWSANSLRRAMVLLGQALPLMVLLFLVFPRFPPLWSVPLPGHQARTGLSESMAPGEIASLSRSAELAFRVSFVTEPLPPDQLYWRAIVLSSYDGKRWTQGFGSRVVREQSDNFQPSAQPLVRYTIYQEPTHRNWLFGLPVIVETQASENQQLSQTGDFELYESKPIHEQVKYTLASDPAAVREPQLPLLRRNYLQQLPAGSNPRARALAQQLAANVSSPNDYVQAVLDWLLAESFTYTLRPPVLGENDIDAFLFDTQRGFCEHFAGSFVFLMRAGGIPARVVTGYLGGERNALTDTLLVHQYDAHAWAEVWLQGRGWVRVDPTAVVAPERIERGLQEALALEGSFLEDTPFSASRFRHIDWINRLRLQWDAFEYYWLSWILQYRGDIQAGFLRQLLGEISTSRILLLFAVILLPFFAVISWQVLRGRSLARQSPAVQAYLQLCRQLERLGFPREPGEPAIDYTRRIIDLLPETSRPHLLAATRAFVAAEYECTDRTRQSELAGLIRREARKVG